jgi:hypothetical protein
VEFEKAQLELPPTPQKKSWRLLASDAQKRRILLDMRLSVTFHV